LNRRSFVLLPLLLLAVFQPAQDARVTQYRQFQKGMTYITYSQDAYATVESDTSLEALAGTGANWVALIVTWYQNTTYKDSSVMPDRIMTPTDDSLIHAIQTIHRLGMKVMLKPHIGLYESVHSRGEIEPTDEKAWFDSYRAFITRYAELAQGNGVEMLSIGTELDLMTQQKYTAYWLAIINGIRQIYGGELTYAASRSEDTAWKDFGFWKELDYIGIDAYFPLTNKTNPTVAELKEGWQKWIAAIEARQGMIKKQIIFTEIGYRDIDGTNIRPWDWQSEGKENQQEQANCYEAALESLWDKPWLQGIYWFSWSPSQTSRSYTPWNKVAETTLRAWYSKPFVPTGTPNDAAEALVDIQEAESAITRAHRENRTRGLDEAQSMLANATAAYDAVGLSQSETLAISAKKMADNAVNQQYDEAAALVSHAETELSKELDDIRNAPLKSEDAISLMQKADGELAVARDALARNEIDTAKQHAMNSTQLLEKAAQIQRQFETTITLGTAAVAAFVALVLMLFIRKRRRSAFPS
jgi:hypothetical protein